VADLDPGGERDEPRRPRRQPSGQFVELRAIGHDRIHEDREAEVHEVAGQ
jgi:hypothetical protein